MQEKQYSMQEILAMSQEQLEQLDTKTLEHFDDMLEEGIRIEHVSQWALKILINALYGAIANKHFLLANPDLSAGVTSSGRFFIQLMANTIERGLKALMPEYNGDFVVYGDTDSIFFDSVINTDKGKFTIGEMFDNNTNPIERTANGHEVKQVQGLKSLTYDLKDGLRYEPIDYIMRHKVKKRMFKVKSSFGEVTVTEDHSLKILRNSEIIDVTAKDLKPGDKIIVVEQIKEIK